MREMRFKNRTEMSLIIIKYSERAENAAGKRERDRSRETGDP